MGFFLSTKVGLLPTTALYNIKTPHYDHPVLQSQAETHRAAVEYQKANGVYKAAKETVSLAEEKIANEQGESLLDPAWQELLNHATAKVGTPNTCTIDWVGADRGLAKANEFVSD